MSEAAGGADREVPSAPAHSEAGASGPSTSGTATGLTNDALLHVVADLDRLADGPLGIWRSVLLKRLGEIREVLLHESAGPSDWLEARRSVVVRERDALRDRLSVQWRQVLGVEDVDRVSYEVRRLVGDVQRHLQRVHDVAWDEVEYEVGGSE